MKRTNGYLFPGEEVAEIVRPHVIVLLKPSIAPFAGLVLVAATPNRFTFAVFLAVLARFAWDVGLWWVDRYILTTDRILSESGVFTKTVVSMPLAKITDLLYTRSLMGRLLGYGTLGLESAGQQGLDRIEFLPDPDHFYKEVMQLALGPRPAPEDDVEVVASPDYQVQSPPVADDHRSGWDPLTDPPPNAERSSTIDLDDYQPRHAHPRTQIQTRIQDHPARSRGMNPDHALHNTDEVPVIRRSDD